MKIAHLLATAAAQARGFVAQHTIGDRIVAIRCNRCRAWVKPRRYDPAYNACTACLPTVKAEHRAAIRAQERHLGLI